MVFRKAIITTKTEPMKSKMKWIVIALTAVLAFVPAAKSQTNPAAGPPVVAPITPPVVVTNQPAIADSTAADIAKVGQDLGINISVKGVSQAIMLAFLIARILLKAVPNTAQKGVFWNWIQHVALQVDPPPKI